LIVFTVEQRRLEANDTHRAIGFVYSLPPPGYPSPMINDEDENRGYGEEGRTPEEQDRAAEGGDSYPRDPEEPRIPSSTQAREELVDRASQDSFPASDPPAYWQRPDADPSKGKEDGIGERDGEPREKSESGKPGDGWGHTRAGSNVPNAGKDPSQDRHE
jgi:hypothetical protein